MKFPAPGFLTARQKLTIGSHPKQRQALSRTLSVLDDKAAPYLSDNIGVAAVSKIFCWFEKLKQLGVSATMEDYERRKLRIFNLLNFFQLVFGIIIPITVMVTHPKISALGWVAACTPPLVSLLVLFLNSWRLYEVSTLCYFILYPVITSIVYLSGMNLGIELFFILYGILAVFFIQDIGHMIFTITLSMISYFILTVVWRNFQFQLEVNGILFLFNHLIAIIFIFFALYLVKKENTNYQTSILNNNRLLYEKNIEISRQRQEIAENVELLNKQANELQDLNALKNKLFSVIAHDLKSPMYALRNIFENIQKNDMPGEDVKGMIPEIMIDLNYTTSLMENLLQWARCQMQSLQVTLQELDVSKLTDEIFRQLNSQAALKQVNMINTISEPSLVLAQLDMLRLVMRNLVSNAIKFTPEEGYVTIGVEENGDETQIYIMDTGIGISDDNLDKINHNQYFSTHGTAAEKGTGLGLMLCKEFLDKNGATLHIESEPGNGSRFSFSLRKVESSVNKCLAD